MPTINELLKRIFFLKPHLSSQERNALLREIQANVIDRLTEPIQRHTIQFWKNENPDDENLPPKPHGSGVLISFDGNHYIVTAAHVVADRNKTHIGVYTHKKDFFEIGTVCETPLEKGETNYNVDLAVWKIEPGTVEDIAPLDWWYPLEDAVFNHQETAAQRYLIFGFPATKVDIRLKDKALVQFPFKFQTCGVSHTPEAQRANKIDKLNFLLKFHRKKVANVRDGHREWAPDPHGISGCGLWYLHPMTQRYHLVGIMTEWKQPREQLPMMMATRIDLVRDTINYLAISTSKS